MNFLPRALCAFLVATSAVFAQRSDEPELEDYVPVVEDDLVVYVPKNAVRLGFRGLTGAISGFSGQGLVSDPDVQLGADTGIERRQYHDGGVGLDTRTMIDPSGTQVPITPDGRTNNWAFFDQSQATPDGLIAMHAYSARVTDSAVREDDPGLALGVEVATEREFGNVFGTRMKWGVVGGVSINQILATTKSEVQADITTITDYYSLGGQAAPTAPYDPTSTNPTLLWSELLGRLTETNGSLTAVVNEWKLRGAYMTFRAGPTLLLPITKRFSATISAGGVMVYAGSTYEVKQTFAPATGAEIVQEMMSNESVFLPGFYVDANLQFDFTDNAGLYLGGVYQSSGDYTQEASTANGESMYKARVDLASLQGIRAGVTFKF
jgi:hypothetical protein